MLQVNEIFLSVSGEVGMFRQGEWAVFVRLAGCNLRCVWCDTERAQQPSGPLMKIEDVVDAVQAYGIPRVVLTGGEPLMQKDTVGLVLQLVRRGVAVQVETNGSYPKPLAWQGMDPEALCVVMDFKLPSSGMSFATMFWETLGPNDWIKFVIQDERDYEVATRLLIDLLETIPAHVAFSACPPLTHTALYDQMKRDGLSNVLLNVQIHKVVGLVENNAPAL